MYFVYILECEDGTLYTGITTDVERRFEQHKAGTASRYTRARGAKRMVYIEEVGEKGDALKRELEIKAYTREEKERLVDGI